MNLKKKEILENSKNLAKKYNCDLSIPNGEETGIGNILMYTRLVEELSLKLGRPIKVLTAPLNPKVGIVNGEVEYPFFENNPFIESILNINDIDKELIYTINSELEDFAQFNHIIENICFSYDVKPRKLKASIFLTKDEKITALKRLSNLKRPLICIHPGGTTSSQKGNSWFTDNWKKIINKYHKEAGFVQIGRIDIDKRESLDVYNPQTTLRELMAIIWASDIFIGFDSSPMHMATAFDKPVLCLFDMLIKEKAESKCGEGYSPSVMLRWSYPQNRNIAILKEKDNESLRLVLNFIDEQVFKLKT